MTIGNGVTSIDGSTFFDCPINVLYCYATKPPMLDYDRDPFYGAKEGATLYVPAGRSGVYKSSRWGDVFDNIIEMD